MPNKDKPQKRKYRKSGKYAKKGGNIPTDYAAEDGGIQQNTLPVGVRYIPGTQIVDHNPSVQVKEVPSHLRTKTFSPIHVRAGFREEIGEEKEIVRRRKGHRCHSYTNNTRQN